MRAPKAALIAKLSMVAVTAVVPVAAVAAPAFASYDDSVGIATTTPSKCPNPDVEAGDLYFVDYGPGAAGGGNNDDYLEVNDDCADGDGVVGYVWLNNVYKGWKYNGNGNGSTVVWDPFPSGNVATGDKVELKACSINGINGTAYNCRTWTFTSRDG